MGASDGGYIPELLGFLLIVVAAGAAAMTVKAKPASRPIWVGLAVAAALASIYLLTRN